MRGHFPEKVDPWLMVEREQVIQGRIPLPSMARLSTFLVHGKHLEDASFSLSFYRDRNRRAVVHCEIETTLNLTCQRCLASMMLPFVIDTRLGLVQGLDEAANLPEELDPLVVAEAESLTLKDLVEDEILLAVPDVPMHSKADCQLDLDDYADSQESDDSRSGSNPFDILAVLKDGDKI